MQRALETRHVAHSEEMSARVPRRTLDPTGAPSHGGDRFSGAVAMRGVSVVLVLSSWAMSACGPDLGTCDMAKATAPLVYLNGVPYTEGQALIYQNCAGSQCHAASAVGVSRTGAPHGLNFDVS